MSAMPVIRVGGDSAFVTSTPLQCIYLICNIVRNSDFVIYVPEQEIGMSETCSTGSRLCMGPSFFDSYNSFPNTYFSHGLNMIWNNDAGFDSITQMIIDGCKMLEGKLSTWEYGNEPDLYIGNSRPSDWDETDYVEGWSKGYVVIQQALRAKCPSLADGPQFLNPSLAGTNSKLDPVKISQGGLNNNGSIAKFSVHNYMGTQDGTLQGQLMNHETNVRKIDEHGQEAVKIHGISNMRDVPYVLGETNSLTGGGVKGVSNTLGAALWSLDWILAGATEGHIKRMHFHQGNGAAYSAWDPVQGVTNAPYYGLLAAAKFMGESQDRSVMNFTLSDDNSLNAVYAGYNTGSGKLDKMAIINFRYYTSGTRGSSNYEFTVPASTTWQIERLTGSSATATSEITFNGYSFDYPGTAQLAGNDSETITVGSDGALNINLPDSSAAILSLVSS